MRTIYVSAGQIVTMISDTPIPTNGAVAAAGLENHSTANAL